jgi:yecA family protein
MKDDFEEIYEEIEELLIKNLGIISINSSYIHGYLTAMNCFPGSISNEKWFEHFFLSPFIENSVKWPSKKIEKEIFETMREALYQVEDYLEVNEFEPLIKGDDQQPTREQCLPWASGFIYALGLWEKEGIDIGKFTNELIGIFFIAYNKALTERYKTETDQGYYSFLKLAESPRNMIIASVGFLYETTKRNISLKFSDLERAINGILKLDYQPEHVHGFLASVACSPLKIEQSDWMKLLYNDSEESNRISDEEYKVVNKSLSEMLNAIKDDLRNDLCIPYRNLQISGDSNFTSWCKGFVLGSELWAHYYSESKEFLADFLILRYYADRDLFLMEMNNKAFSKEFEEKIKELNPLQTIKNSISGIFSFSTQTSVSITRVNSESKAGRNDPCPCGSGKKYKKCCGK